MLREGWKEKGGGEQSKRRWHTTPLDEWTSAVEMTMKSDYILPSFGLFKCALDTAEVIIQSYSVTVPGGCRQSRPQWA